MTEPETGATNADKITALTDEDRAWLTEHGWRDTSNDYPTIGVEEGFIARRRRQRRERNGQ